ncbi:DNA-processing protein DprA [Marinigracilibium pacificum]|uniref:DNA-protecting protein DprA n=1 Tax=Marinigracilibium pacificum TaxID=2729599 RepID=A0A848IY70_9BACT|nr:DNA-processing protein DprA [Marinigracilibium pacificum]NMM49237.1 DNA-protecting protein DprA [Marinigracilibium pacificum]
MKEDLQYAIALQYIPGVGSKTAKLLVSYLGSAKKLFFMPKGKLKSIPGIGDKFISKINDKCKSEALEKADNLINKCNKLNIGISSFYDDDYPSRLKECVDAPLTLYYKGDFNCLSRKKILAVVGTRNASTYGNQATESIIQELSYQEDLLIVSGLAKGIDGKAHRSSLNHNIPTVGVLGHGLDMIYPASHKSLAKEMTTNGCLISEYPPGTLPDFHNFPARNRIIAGIADAVLVVEAASKGGALITADIAFSYNRDVFAIPGNLTSQYSQGCNDLIRRNSAAIVTNGRDIAEALNWDICKSSTKSRTPSSQLDLSKYTLEERQILSVLIEKPEGIHIDDLSWRSQVPLPKMASILLSLELSGVIKSLPGKTFSL